MFCAHAIDFGPDHVQGFIPGDGHKRIDASISPSAAI